MVAADNRSRLVNEDECAIPLRIVLVARFNRMAGTTVEFNGGTQATSDENRTKGQS